LEWAGAGVNHQVFISRLAHRRVDLYPRLREMAEQDPDFSRTVRADLLRRFGHYVTESSKHNAEYLPWYLPWDDQLERFSPPLGPVAAARAHQGDPRGRGRRPRGRPHPPPLGRPPPPGGVPPPHPPSRGRGRSSRRVRHRRKPPHRRLAAGAGAATRRRRGG